MTWNSLSVLAVVPARGGSKGIPDKNLRKVGGWSLIEHSARTAAALSWIDRTVLSTDDEKIAEEGRRCGLEVPFLRPAALAGDLSPTVEAWRHAWLESEEHFGRRFDISLLLQPTTPLRRPEDVERTVRVMVEGAAPVTIQLPELGQALATGAANNFLTSSASGADGKLYEQVKFFYPVNGWLPRNVTAVSQKAFDALDKPTQDAVLKAAADAEARGWKMSEKVDEDSIKILKDNGVTVAPPSASVSAALQKIGETMTTEWLASAGPDGKAIIDAYRKK